MNNAAGIVLVVLWIAGVFGAAWFILCYEPAPHPYGTLFKPMVPTPAQVLEARVSQLELAVTTPYQHLLGRRVSYKFKGRISYYCDPVEETRRGRIISVQLVGSTVSAEIRSEDYPNVFINVLDLKAIK